MQLFSYFTDAPSILEYTPEVKARNNFGLKFETGLRIPIIPGSWLDAFHHVLGRPRIKFKVRKFTCEKSDDYHSAMDK